MNSDDKIIGCFFGAWIVYVLLFLAFWGAVIYVGLHFIAKAW